jgi:hypothetical protein
LSIQAFFILKPNVLSVRQFAVLYMFNGLAADFYDAGVQKLVTLYMCLKLHGNYVATPLSQSLTVFTTNAHAAQKLLLVCEQIKTFRARFGLRIG